MVSYVFITLQLCSENCSEQFEQSAFHEESLQGRLQIISSSLLLKGWSGFRSGYWGPVKLNLEFFQQGRFHYFSGQLISMVSCLHGEAVFSYLQDRISPEAAIPTPPSPTTMQPCKERTSHLSTPIIGHGKTVIKFPLSLLFWRLIKSVLSVVVQTSRSPSLLTSSWLYCGWVGCN